MRNSKAGITEVFEGHHGPVTGLSCHSAGGPVDFSHLFISSSFDWTVKLWSTKVRHTHLHTNVLLLSIMFLNINPFLFLLYFRVPVHCTPSRIVVTTFMMPCGLQHILLCLPVWTLLDVWTCGTLTMTPRYGNNMSFDIFGKCT